MDQFNRDLFFDLIATSEESIKFWEGREISPRAAHSVLSRACTIFGIMLENGFPEWLCKNVEESAASREDARTLLNNLDAYTTLLDVEKSILVESGMDGRTADVVLHHIAAFRNSVSFDETLNRLNPDAVQQELSTTTEQICAAAGTMKDVERRKTRRWAVLSAGLQLTGWGLQAANSATFVATIVATSGLTIPAGAVTLASVVSGRGLVMAGQNVGQNS